MVAVYYCRRDQPGGTYFSRTPDLLKALSRLSNYLEPSGAFRPAELPVDERSKAIEKLTEWSSYRQLVVLSRKFSTSSSVRGKVPPFPSFVLPVLRTFP